MTRGWRAHILSLVAGILGGVGCSSYGSNAPYTSVQLPELPREFRIPSLILRALDLPAFEAVGPPLLPFIPIVVRFSGPTRLELVFTTAVPPSRDFSLAWQPCLWADPSQRVCAHSAAMSWSVTPGRAPVHDSWSRELSGSAEPGAERLTRAAIYEHAGYGSDSALTTFHVMAVYTFQCETTCPEHLRLDFRELFESEGIPRTSESLDFRREQSSGYRPFFLPWDLHG